MGLPASPVVDASDRLSHVNVGLNRGTVSFAAHYEMERIRNECGESVYPPERHEYEVIMFMQLQGLNDH